MHQLNFRQKLERSGSLRVMSRLVVAVVVATLGWAPSATKIASAIYCYAGDPPAVYQACLAYNQGIGQQVNNQQQLQNIQSQINNAVAQINAIDTLIANLNKQIAAQRALIAQTQTTIDDLSRQIRFSEAELTRLKAHLSVRDELLNQRLRYIEGHGAFNNVELILTAKSFNDLMNRLVAEQQITVADKQLIADLQQEHALVAVANTALGGQRDQMSTLLLQQKATEADLQKNLSAQAAALEFEAQLQVKLAAQYQAVQAERAAIDAQVAQLAQQYAAAAIKAGGGSGVFEWPLPACGPSCISQPFGCSTFYLEIPDPSCPYPHKIHTGIDIAGPYGTQILAADTGVVYLYPGSIGYGNLVVMIHGNGYSTYYGHTAGYAPGLHSGDIVPRGTTIAFEGMTGWATGPHLHFEVRVNNVYKDPCIWLGC
jgi:murein DD-endopeptidase MepM/ murein hydrolase activator NlpD